MPIPVPVPRMSPSPSTSNNRSQMPTMPMKRPMGSGPMQPRSHVGAVGKRPRTSLPQPQPSQPGGYHQGPPMPSKRFPNLGSGISISFSGDSEGGPSGNNSRQPQQAPMRKPMPSTSRGMQQPFSSNNRYLFFRFQSWNCHNNFASFSQNDKIEFEVRYYCDLTFGAGVKWLYFG